MEFEFMSADTVLPPCMPLPAAMLRLPISSTAKVMYILSGEIEEHRFSMKRKEVSEYLDISMDTLRNWEMNGLLTVKRKENGYRVYTDEDIKRLKVIRALRCAKYSLEAILRMLRQLSKNPDIDIKAALNTPRQSEDV